MNPGIRRDCARSVLTLKWRIADEESRPRSMTKPTENASRSAALSRWQDGRLTECAAVIVTYFPSPANLENIAAIAGQFGLTVIVDNASPPETQAELRKRAAADSRIVLRLLPSNLGLGAGCNEGIATAREKEFGWCVTFDQDTTVPPEFASQVAKAVGEREWPENVGLFAPRHVHPISKDASAYTPTISRHGGYSEIEAAIQSGTIVNVQIHEKVGGFSDGLFVDYVDYEYGFRLQKLGYRCIQLDEAVLVHQVGERQRRKILGVIPIRIPVNVHSPSRQYYLIRNRLHVVRHYGAGHLRWAFRELTRGTIVLAALLLTDKKRGACARYAFRGAKDALRGRLGPLVAGSSAVPAAEAGRD
jgi:rhamnosyltransferase